MAHGNGTYAIGNGGQAAPRRLSGRAALITGASAGIGRAIALALAREGAEIIATGRREAELASVVTLCRAAGAEAQAIAGDLNRPAFINDLAAAAAHVDILVNNAAFLVYAPLLETSVADCAAMLQTNVVSAFAISREIGRRMVERRQGHMVFISSLSARNVHALGVAYAATKHALSALAKGFRLELKADGIKVTEIAPGMVATDIRKSSSHPAVLDYIATRDFTPLAPSDIAEAVVFSLTTTAGCCPDLIELRPRER